MSKKRKNYRTVQLYRRTARIEIWQCYRATVCYNNERSGILLFCFESL